MWITVLILAIAMNFEPSRPVWVPLMLARPRPILQLFAFGVGCFVSSLVAGLLVLFVFHKSPFTSGDSNGATIQIAVGAFGLLIAAVMASNLSLARFKRADDPESEAEGALPRGIDKMSERAKTLLRKGNSPWLSATIGFGIGMPSLEYLAALVVIASSGAGPVTDVLALVVFILVGNALVTVPLCTYLFAPEQTRRWIDSFQEWLRARGRREFAAILAAMGVVQIVIGLIRL